MGRRIPESALQSDTAVQYLTWALEEIERLGRTTAADHVEAALDDLRGIAPDLTAGRMRSDGSSQRENGQPRPTLQRLPDGGGEAL